MTGNEGGVGTVGVGMSSGGGAKIGGGAGIGITGLIFEIGSGSGSFGDGMIGCVATGGVTMATGG